MGGDCLEGRGEAVELTAPGGQERADAGVGEGLRMVLSPPGRQLLPLLSSTRYEGGRRRGGGSGGEGLVQAGDLVGEGGGEPRVPVGGAQGPTGDVSGHHVGGAERVVAAGLQGDGAGSQLGWDASENLELGLHGAGQVMGRASWKAQDPGPLPGADSPGRVALTGPQPLDRSGRHAAQLAGIDGGPNASGDVVVGSSGRWSVHSPVHRHRVPSARPRSTMARAASVTVSRAVSRRRSASGQGT